MADLTATCRAEVMGEGSVSRRVCVSSLFKLLGSPASRPSPMLPTEVSGASPEPQSMVAAGASAPATGAPTHGLTIAEFAEWARVDRRRVAQHLVEIPPGPAPVLSPGKVPCRLIGGTRRIFVADFRGGASAIGVGNGEHHQEAPAGAGESASPWAGQVARLRSR